MSSYAGSIVKGIATLAQRKEYEDLCASSDDEGDFFSKKDEENNKEKLNKKRKVEDKQDVSKAHVHVKQEKQQQPASSTTSTNTQTNSSSSSSSSSSSGGSSSETHHTYHSARVLFTAPTSGDEGSSSSSSRSSRNGLYEYRVLPDCEEEQYGWHLLANLFANRACLYPVLAQANAISEWAEKKSCEDMPRVLMLELFNICYVSLHDHELSSAALRTACLLFQEHRTSWRPSFDDVAKALRLFGALPVLCSPISSSSSSPSSSSSSSSSSTSTSSEVSQAIFGSYIAVEHDGIKALENWLLFLEAAFLPSDFAVSSCSAAALALDSTLRSLLLLCADEQVQANHNVRCAAAGAVTNILICCASASPSSSTSSSSPTSSTSNALLENALRGVICDPQAAQHVSVLSIIRHIAPSIDISACVVTRKFVDQMCDLTLSLRMSKPAEGVSSFEQILDAGSYSGDFPDARKMQVDGEAEEEEEDRDDEESEANKLPRKLKAALHSLHRRYAAKREKIIKTEQMPLLALLQIIYSFVASHSSRWDKQLFKEIKHGCKQFEILAGGSKNVDSWLRPIRAVVRAIETHYEFVHPHHTSGF